MNILVVGNGFDLAHGLPTKYSDFLNFVNFINQLSSDVSNISEIEDKILFKEIELDQRIHDLFYDKLFSLNLPHTESSITYLSKWKLLIGNNLWIKYFNDNIGSIGENWIDFEKEISIFIQGLEGLIKEKDVSDAFIPLHRFTKDVFNANRVFKALYDPFCTRHGVNYMRLKKCLEDDLNNLILALERYLIEFVEQINTNLFSIDILYAHIDKVISFNYTNTFEKKYCSDFKIPIDFIHGHASKNNIVLGIDEYLSPYEKDSNTEFNKFKKFHQIIYKDIAHEYKNWLKKDIRAITKPPVVHNLYIFGHSLDITDRDVLKELILCKNVHTTIFYHNTEVKGKLISNLQKIIGQEELKERTNYPDRTIVFKRQSKLVNEKSFNKLINKERIG